MTNSGSRIFVVTCALAMLPCACADGSGTGGRSVIFDVAIEPPSSAAEPGGFPTETGWQVELDEAFVVVGPLYLYEDAPRLSARADEELDLLSSLGELLVPTAHAHPGDVFFDGGLLRGEFIGQVVFDLLADQTLSIGPARGVAGPARSVTVVLDPPGGTILGDVESLRGHQAWVRGVARRGDETVEFEGGLDLGAELIQRQVDGVPIDIELDDDGTLVIGVRADAWFSEADFSTLDDVADSGRLSITPDSQVAVAWTLGLRSTRGFFARWTDDEDFEPY
jgi:hypothetical protein